MCLDSRNPIEITCSWSQRQWDISTFINKNRKIHNNVELNWWNEYGKAILKNSETIDIETSLNIGSPVKQFQMSYL